MSASPATKEAPAAMITNASALLDWLKPRRGIAIARLRKNGFAMLAMLLVTQLAPVVPSPATCLWMLYTGGKRMSWTTKWSCWLELLVFAVLAANILQSYLALRYPPLQYKPNNSPAMRAQVRSPLTLRSAQGFAPKLSQSNKSFTSSYTSSPPSTPSRVINYKTPLTLSNSPSSSPFQTSLNSSFSASLLSSPLGYRARPSNIQSIRSLRGSLLNQLEAEDDDGW